MASAFVDKALQDVELLGRDFDVDNYALEDLEMCLRNLRTFLLCARKHNESDENASCGSLGSFLSNLEGALFKSGKDFHDLCLKEKETFGNSHLSTHMYKGVFQLKECIYDFKQEITDSYITLLNCCSLQSRDQSMEFIGSLLVNMADIREQFFYEGQDPIGDLKEKLVFFTNFIRFVKLRGFEPWQLQVLFTHLDVVAMDAARFCLEWTFHSDKYDMKLRDKFRLMFSELLQKIKPDDPQIREAYIQVLTTSKFSGSSHALTLKMDKHVLGEFIDSLLYNIVEALRYGDKFMVSLKDEVPLLYEGLGFLRTILTKHLEKIDELHEKVKDLIGAAVSEAGILICSLPLHELKDGSAKEMDFALCNLMEKIKLIKVLTSAIIFPRTDELGFMDFLLENLEDLSTCKADWIVVAKDQIRTVQEGLVSLRSLLENIMDYSSQDGKLSSLWSRGVTVAYKTQSVILSFVVGDIPDGSPLEFKHIAEEINLIRMEGLKIADNPYGFEAQKAFKTSNPSPPKGSTPAINKIVVPLEDEKQKIIEQLFGVSRQLEIISIVGMAGLGKTTLALTVYDHPLVRDHFHTRAWCAVSKVYKRNDLLLQILGSLRPDLCDEYVEKNELVLEKDLEIFSPLKYRRYLIVLDDVWDIEAWCFLKKLLPNDANGSRILLTSRHSDVAMKIMKFSPRSQLHTLRFLTDDESWDLLQKKLSWKEGYPEDLGRKIAKNCKGLPLAVVIIAGVLSNLELDGWEEIAGRPNFSADFLIDQCMHTLELSYTILPDCLKPCFLYFGAFPKDEEIRFRGLIWLWIAEGFVKRFELKSLEDVAMEYMNDLIGRSLVMVSKKTSMGGIKTCRIHDLLHEFCITKAKRGNFLSLLSGYDELFTFHGQRGLLRLCVFSSREHLEKSRLFCPGVRSLLIFADDKDQLQHYRISFIFHLFKHLKVLDLMHINLGSTFPSEITLLVELRYLAAQGEFNFIPSTLANLSGLETLIVSANEVLLPDTIWNMLKLRVLYLSGSWFLDSVFVEDSLGFSSDLQNLDTFSTLELAFGQSMEKIIRKMPNIRRLKCKLFKSGESNTDCNGIVAMDFLSRLESLHVTLPEDKIKRYNIGFSFPCNLKKLTLSGTHSSMIPESGQLPNLEALKLLKVYFERNIWDMKEKLEFPKLKFLELRSLRIVRWAGSDGDHFPCLQKLVLIDCVRLKEVPSCLEDISCLEMIEVRHCPKSVESLLLKIKEEQNDLGNDDIQMLTSNIF